MRKIFITLFSALLFTFVLSAQGHEGHDHDDQTTHEHADATEHDDHGCACHHDEKYDAGATAFHHIADANTFRIWGDLYLPLPCILYAPEAGLSTFMSSKFELGGHGDGTKAIDRFVLHHGTVMRVADDKFPMGEVAVECFTSRKEGDEDVFQVIYQGQCYDLHKKSTLDGGVLGGGITSYYDFSITKNVFTMILGLILLLWLFGSAAKAYTTRDGQAPKGAQSFLEPVFVFIRDEVAIPFLGDKYEKYLPFLMSIFFFILGMNLIGQIPFFPGSGNVTGNLAVTMALTLFVFIIVQFSGNKHYWEHIFWMPGVPAWVKIILTPVEVLGVFIKPVTLMLRLFANITAGHIVIIIFVSLIFIFGDAGESVAGSIGGGIIAVPLTLFMMAIELLVAFIQAFVFCILAASYLGAATEEHHSEHH
ncbi:MAG: hypothetical protein DHS20C18_10430 [Saprospiraceae bacterium]|nr:MAG: hypothetical protein DHS20C18_10430 [Saprospiraceae bacterium]